MHTTPLLTLNIPVGLGFGSSTNSQAGTIQVQGAGHNLVFNSIFAPISNQRNSTRLAVKPGNTIALVGGNVTFDGGVVNAPMGRVEIGAVSNTPTQIRLSSTTQGWTLGYEPPYARCQLNNIPFFFIISFIFSQLFLIKVIRHPAHAVKSMYWKNNILFGCLQPSFQGFADDEK